MRVIGIDPGFGRCGIAVMDDASGKPELLHSSCVITHSHTPFSDRLCGVADVVSKTIERFSPEALAIEEIFFSKNQKTAIQVAEIRGVVLYLAARQHIPVTEFNPGRVKIAVTGDGRADKTQVASMLLRSINFDRPPKLDDEFDAVALCVAFLAEYRSWPH